ncbi:hypothetical protein GV829_13175 [Sphingomonas lacunae]|uniref:Apea-like HEPN domain-containing protein n=1 Tax=Sphingomonas lacunae TaxID=2698828 RepID=A0A6M4B1I1_9SPHN|nr:hypothetical protein [Sphingomonas lacunae]QJQ33271.1 hypothetical protein GV829_13175 [Sphingomonas lacunae]
MQQIEFYVNKAFKQMQSPQPSQAFFAIRIGQGSDYKGFSFGTDLEGIKSWAKSPAKHGELETPPATPTEIAPSTEHQLAELMSRAADMALGLSELILALSSVASALTDVVTRSEIVKPIEESSPLIEEGDDYKIYSITQDRLIKVRSEHRRLNRMDRGFEVIPTSVLLTIVATFDSITADIVRTMLGKNPERFVSLEKTVKIADILGNESFEDFKSRIVDDEVYAFSRGSHESQVQSIERWFDIKISESWERWGDFIEIFERRNLIAHGEKLYTQRYVSICSKNKVRDCASRLGDKIQIDRSYLTKSLSILTEFSILMIFSIWRKQFPEQQKHAFDTINEVCYRFISQARYSVPVKIIEYVTGLKNTDVDQATILMMKVNLASSYRHMDKVDECNEVLNSVDWSAVSDRYGICVAALREDIDLVCDLFAPVVSSGKMEKNDFREWPVFDFIRNNDKFQEKFLNVFNEPLFEAVVDSSSISE